LTWTDYAHATLAYNSTDTSDANTQIDYLSHEYTILFDKSQAFDNAYGILDMVLNQGWEDDTLHDISKLDFAYDNQNRLTTMTQRLFNHVEWIDHNKYSFDYDVNGNPARYSEQAINFQDQTWDNITTQFVYTWEEHTASSDETIPAVALSINTYPNPFNNNLTIDLNSKDGAPFRASIYNLKGQLVKQFDLQHSKSLVWDGKDNAGNMVSAGIYLIKVKQNGMVKSQKVVKVR
jgi:hypothetical protein